MQDNPPHPPRSNTSAPAPAFGRIMTRLLLLGIAVCFVIFGEVQWTQGAGMLQSLGPWFLLVGGLVFVGEIAFRTWQSWPRHQYIASSQNVSDALGNRGEWAAPRENILLVSAGADAPAPTPPTPELSSRSALSASQSKQRHQMGLRLLLFLLGVLVGVIPLSFGVWAQQQYFDIVRAYATLSDPYDASTSAKLYGLMQMFTEAALPALYGVLPASMLLVFRPLRFFALGVLLGVLLSLGGLFILSYNFE